ncbi:MAG: hypothetical protein M5U33_00230 [Pseudorhodoplanes sp.]|nr:hypothetical protein [Pseudorhodoplanes sp.]
MDVGVGADHAEAIALVVERLLIPDLRDRRADAGGAGGDGFLAAVAQEARFQDRGVGARLQKVLLENQAVAHLLGHRHGRKEPAIGLRHQHGRLGCEFPGQGARARCRACGPPRMRSSMLENAGTAWP